LEDGVLAMEALALKLSGVNTDYAPDSAETFLEAVDAINSSSTDCVYNIMMNGKFTVDSVSFVPNGKKTIILTGASAGCLISSGGGSSALFTIPEGITLILDGNAALNGNAGTAVTVDVRGGKLIMKKGASIQAGMRGGVMVRGGGSFQMEDGEISGNTRPSGGGGGVYVGIGSSFTMQGGSITGNMAELGGGVYVGGSGASFTMQGGSITGNMGELGGGVYVSGSGASFTMQGGVISANRAERGGGVYIESGRFVKSGGRVESDNSSFDMALVYVFDGGKERINAAGPGVKLDSSRAGQSGGWE
ncbi:MAG: hypothetical protein LBH18_00700, partial [Spirochaetaceae bacterium]|nr:hypothetical protein [Spirochaetaceae bacterium]